MRRRQITDRREDDAGQNYDRRAKPHNDTVNARRNAQIEFPHRGLQSVRIGLGRRLEPLQIAAQRRFQVPQIMLGRDTVVNRLEPPGYRTHGSWPR